MEEKSATVVNLVKKGGTLSEEHKKKIGDAQRGSKNHMYGKPSWNNGVRGEELKKHYKNGKMWSEGKKYKDIYGEDKAKEIKRKISRKGSVCNEETKEKMSNAHKGKKPYDMNSETKKKISATVKEKWNSGAFEKCKTGWFRRGMVPYNKGKSLEEIHGPDEAREMRKRMSDAKVGTQAKEKHPNWKGGKSYEPYGLEFNRKLKAQVRLRDRYRCQECFRHQSELPTKLHIHHIDYDKKNNNPENLISLCRGCHLQTNFKRDDWVAYFHERNSQGEGKICDSP